MQIAVVGSSPAAQRLRANLTAGGYVVTDRDGALTCRIEPYDAATISLDIVDGPFGRLATHRIADLAPTGGVFVQARGGNLDDRVVVACVPADPAAEAAVALGLLRAVDQWHAVHGLTVKAAGHDNVTRLLQEILASIMQNQDQRDAVWARDYGAPLLAFIRHPLRPSRWARVWTWVAALWP